ncbi:hypothetical protein KLA_15745 [Cellulophaga geojensis KL-A]|uniref:Uncharacterized protein n=1 Tax=Cellulophaga geojensis KL-A TaxID=1328323 RepID=A0ABN0RK95_9FLAO|nr:MULTISPECIES: hypothetical protein [Cellulophaga]EWH11464.1 hypothetical protein KLA_15745 [Cellulophaga geojensis KL-A]MDO6855294.1 hypothetical protein [Cellulophaga lytica]
MKIFSTEPNGNEVAEYVGTEYIKFSIELIEDDIKWLKKTKDIAQPLLANIEILLLITKKYSTDANLLLKKESIKDWKTVFYEWYERVNSKIPAKFKEGIKQNADELFAELEQYGH